LYELIVQPAVGSEPVETARRMLLVSRSEIEENQRPLNASYTIRGSVNWSGPLPKNAESDRVWSV
jgi:hypothetical protein